jgi:hypothetical protein
MSTSQMRAGKSSSFEHLDALLLSNLGGKVAGDRNEAVH